MDPSRRYKVSAPDDAAFEAARKLLRANARVLVENPRRRTIAATEIDAATETRLRALEAEISEDRKYDLE